MNDPDGKLHGRINLKMHESIGEHFFFFFKWKIAFVSHFLFFTRSSVIYNCFFLQLYRKNHRHFIRICDKLVVVKIGERNIC